MSDPSEPSEKPDTQGPSAEPSEASKALSNLEAKEPKPEAEASDAAADPAPTAGALEPATQETAGEVGSAAPAPESAPPSEHPESDSPVHLTEEQLELLHRRRRDKSIGLVIITATFVLSMIGSLYAKKLSEPEISKPPEPPTTEGIENWPKEVDPLQVLSVAREITPRNLFRGFVAEMVDSEGTIDFTKKGPRVRYSFQSEPGHGPQPPRKPGTLPRRTYCGKQNVHIRSLGVVADPDMSSYPCAAEEKEPLPDPGCTIKQVWEHALKNGAPKKKTARIEYYRSEAGPAYRFSIPGTKHRFSLYGDCARELKGKDAAGGVP